MSLSQSGHTILSYAEFQKDMLRMGVNDKKIFESWVKVDDDLCLSDLIATIKNLPQDKNDSSTNVIAFPTGIQP